jgi:hypothetical protein
VQWWVIVSPLDPRFCSSKVIETDEDRWINGSECLTRRLPWKNLIFLMQSSFVLRLPFTAKYSHERIAKKNAPMNNSQRALSISDNESL